MAQFFATQTLTITYGKYIEAETRDEALNIACEEAGDLDKWKEVYCESGDSVYIDEVYTLEQIDKSYSDAINDYFGGKTE